MENECDVLVLGATGMLGSTVMRYFASRQKYSVIGTMRGSDLPSNLKLQKEQIIGRIDAENADELTSVLSKYRPKNVINCIGLVKQLADSADPLKCMPINSILPHRLAKLCDLGNARLIHFSTDCVFNGQKGMYLETDTPNAQDLYGRSKLLGEVIGDNSLTLRTSIIGHELTSAHSLLEWFLSQSGASVNGFRRAVFSGLPTVEVARVLHDYVLTSPQLTGLYHVSSSPISKLDLLTLIAKEYALDVSIKSDDTVVIDRSLDSTKFRSATNFQPKSWTEMISVMKEFG